MKIKDFGKCFIAINGRDHPPPHVHVVSTDAEALVEIATLEVIGELPRGSKRKVMIFIKENRDSLIETFYRRNPQLLH